METQVGYRKRGPEEKLHKYSANNAPQTFGKHRKHLLSIYAALIFA